jgi:biopolymer transport protein ExbD
MAYKPEVGPTMSAPNVIPMADIMLVLLIIFMVVTPMLQKGYSVTMARVPDPEALPAADRDDAITIAVTRDGSAYLQLPNTTGTQKTPEDQITQLVRDAVTDRADKTIFIRADVRAKYGDLTKIVDDVRSAGVDQIGLLTERVEHQAPGAPAPTATPVK